MAAMKCPHCTIAFTWTASQHQGAGQDSDGYWQFESTKCPECGKIIIQLVLLVTDPRAPSTFVEKRRRTVQPRATNRPPCPPQVPAPIRTDYLEACLVLEDSPKASAALSRRALQHILRDAAGVKPGNLADEIDQVVASKKLQSSVAGGLNAVRHIGNFAAHPTASKNTGEIIDVEPGEAEWNLDVVEALMDVYYVQPATMAANKAALNAKLVDAGKPPIP
jgi:hypothetical protein